MRRTSQFQGVLLASASHKTPSYAVARFNFIPGMNSRHLKSPSAGCTEIRPRTRLGPFKRRFRVVDLGPPKEASTLDRHPNDAMPILANQGREILDVFIERASHDPTIPPFVFGVTTSEGEVYFKGSGNKHLGDPSKGEIDADSVFWLCSQSKLMTHLAAMQLVGAGQLSLDTPVSQYIPEFANLLVMEDVAPIPDLIAQTEAGPTLPKPAPKFHPAKEVMLVKHLMHYTSGLFYPFDVLPDWDKEQDTPYAYPHDPEDPVGTFLKGIKEGLPGIPVKFEPGTDWAYGWSSDILGFVIEKVTGTTLEEYMQAHIFGPLGMTRTSFRQSKQMKENLVSVTLRGEGGKLRLWDHPFYEADPEKIHLHCGGAAILSSARDYLTFLRHLLQIHEGIVDPDNAIISRERLMELFAPSLTEKAQETMESFLGPALPAHGIQWSNGQGVITADWPAMRKRGSGFWSGYLNTNHWIDPATGVAAVFQSQLLPPLDRGLAVLGAQLEIALYASLNCQ
ncbi:hypothetical protein NMY22_g3753 [Coprinellus aureogranulatus]|nr:hypothetical protein NMY22_g3753 [Coprinellus aureogranulatus]